MAFCIYTYFFVAIFGRQFFLNKDDVPTSTPVYLPRPRPLPSSPRTSFTRTDLQTCHLQKLASLATLLSPAAYLLPKS